MTRTCCTKFNQAHLLTLVLSLPLDDPGFDASILTDYRQRELASALGVAVA